MTETPSDTKAVFELHFRPNVRLVSLVRRFVSDFYEHIIPDPDTVSRLALATHELLENAVKYSTDGATTLSISVDEATKNHHVVIRIKNRASNENITIVRDLLHDLSEKDPFEHYQMLMQRSVKLKDGSGLGLARVRAEGEMEMSHTVDGDEICIQAETLVLNRAGGEAA